MTQPLPESPSMIEWTLVTIMGNTPPPRDPNDNNDDDDEDEDSHTEPDGEREPAVIREPDEDE